MSPSTSDPARRGRSVGCSRSTAERCPGTGSSARTVVVRSTFTPNSASGCSARACVSSGIESTWRVADGTGGNAYLARVLRPWSLHRRLGIGLSRGEPGVDGVLVGLEDADLHDLVVLDPVDVGASDVEDVLAGTEPLVHEQRDMVAPDEGVDQVERRCASGARDGCADVGLDGGPTSPWSGEGRPTRHVAHDVVGEVLERRLPVTRAHRGKVAAHDLDRLHDETLPGRDRSPARVVHRPLRPGAETVVATCWDVGRGCPPLPAGPVAACAAAAAARARYGPAAGCRAPGWSAARARWAGHGQDDHARRGSGRPGSRRGTHRAVADVDLQPAGCGRVASSGHRAVGRYRPGADRSHVPFLRLRDPPDGGSGWRSAPATTAVRPRAGPRTARANRW